MSDAAPAERPRIRKVGDWHQLVPKLDGIPDAGLFLNGLRFECYKEIEKLRGRPLFVYAVKFPGAHPKAPVQIDLSDVDGFTDLISNVPAGSDSVDVLIHSPGGSAEATERIVGLLRSAFTQVAFLVPHSAYSAATMLALSGDEVILHPSGTLGPIDPQIDGTPARSIQRGFVKVRDLLRDEGPEALPAFVPLIEKLSLQLLEVCEDSLRLSQELVQEWMHEYMFHGDEAARDIVKTAVEFLSDYDSHKTHARPLTHAKLKPLELKISLADDPLKELLREAHLLLQGFFGITPFVKLFEDARGISWGHRFQQGALPVPAQSPPPSAVSTAE